MVNNAKMNKIKKTTMEKCPQCEGYGTLLDWKLDPLITCELCRGTGKIKKRSWYYKSRGEELREWRIAQELTLRDAALKYKIDPSNLSKMERGILKPNVYYK